MQRTMLKSKIHRATVTGAKLNYEGSITIDPDLLEAANMLAGEQVHVLNCSNGARFITYTLVGERGSGTVLLNGPAARLGQVGDKIIIITYASLTDDEAMDWDPAIIMVDENNRRRE